MVAWRHHHAVKTRAYIDICGHFDVHGVLTKHSDDRCIARSYMVRAKNKCCVLCQEQKLSTIWPFGTGPMGCDPWEDAWAPWVAPMGTTGSSKPMGPLGLAHGPEHSNCFRFLSLLHLRNQAPGYSRDLQV